MDIAEKVPVEDDSKAVGHDSDSNGHKDDQGPIPPRLRLLHDPKVSFQEYQYYAGLTRQEEDLLPPTTAGKNVLAYVVPNLKKFEGEEVKVRDINTSDPEKRLQITDQEWSDANRALRIATSGAVFYLITTDILGPFALPYAFATTGWGPGTALYTVFAAMAGYGGYLLHDVFIGLDSYQFPIKAYGDLGFRVFGQWARLLFNFLQGIQLLCFVAVIIISNGQALSEATKFQLCYAVCCLVWALAGYFFGQIRTLQKFGWLANVAVFVNLMIIFVTMGAAATTPPLYSAYVSSAGNAVNPASVTPVKGVYPPIQHSGGLPTSGNLYGSVNGAMQAVYAYGGATIFPEFMSEMRRPRDFLKGMWGAQLFIYICYMIYGLTLYYWQGQYILNPSYLGISKYNLQTAGNSLAMFTALIAAALYGNIGVKVVYNNILVEFFRAPPLNVHKGKIMWIIVIPIYWTIAYVIGAAIPDFSGFTGIVSSTCVLQFSYTFPPLIHLGYAIQRNAALSEPGFDRRTGQVIAKDRGFYRYVRGFFGYRWYMNVFNFFYLLAALATAGLGIWASVENLKEIYSVPQLTAYGCHSPVAP